MHPTYEMFEQAARAEGFSEVVERTWAPGQIVDSHGHPFEAHALVVKGEMWLTVNGETRHLMPGDRFVLAANEQHEERYGPQGAVYWVARR
jgi:quercetin dioxygenase-like cupin family protein